MGDDSISLLTSYILSSEEGEAEVKRIGVKQKTAPAKIIPQKSVSDLSSGGVRNLADDSVANMSVVEPTDESQLAGDSKEVPAGSSKSGNMSEQDKTSDEQRRLARERG